MIGRKAKIEFKDMACIKCSSRSVMAGTGHCQMCLNAKESWQCHICGTVYAWWVSKCREKHLVKESPPDTGWVKMEEVPKTRWPL